MDAADSLAGWGGAETLFDFQPEPLALSDDEFSLYMWTLTEQPTARPAQIVANEDRFDWMT